jgi:photosystem II stability/assembly factor-like uncharacterized protein
VGWKTLLRAWFRPPYGLLAAFLAVTLGPALGLIPLGWRLLDQDRALAGQRIAERRENAADQVVAALQRELGASERDLAQLHAPAPDDDALLVELAASGMRVYPNLGSWRRVHDVGGGSPATAMRVRMVTLALAACATSFAPHAVARQGTTPAANPDPLLATYDAHLAMARSSPFRKLTWSFLGPTNISGRALDVAVADRGSRRRIYVAYHTGGLWKTDDNGTTWQPVPTGAASPYMYAVAVAPSNPDIVWAGTHAGVYKSVDAGRTWRHMGLGGATGDWLLRLHFGRIVVHPADSNIVYVTAEGPEDTDMTPRGLFRTTDGGKTWRNVLYRNPRTDAVDVVIDPKDPKTLYAATRQNIFDARAGLFSGQDPDANQTSIWKSTDGGATWAEAATGLAAPRFRSRIDIGIARSNPNVLYAVVDNREPLRPAAPGEVDTFGNPRTLDHFKGAEIYRTDDQGRTWRKVNSPGIDARPGSWFRSVRVDPTDENTIYLPGQQLSVSHDGGRVLQMIAGPHVDHNGFWIDPKDPSVFYDCTDGGVYLFANYGATWTYTPVPTTQFYDVALDQATPFHAYGSVQDNGSFRGVVDVRNGRDGLRGAVFESAPGWESTRHAIDGQDPTIVFADPSTQGRLFRFELSGSPTARNITPPAPAGTPVLRHTWLLPFILSAHDAKTVYAGYQYVFRSRDRGDHWERISEDLTDNDPVRRAQPPWINQAVSSVAESPRKQGLVYVGTDDGRLHVTMDDGTTWTDLTTGLPRPHAVTGLVASTSAEGTVYVTQTVGGLGFHAGVTDATPYIYKSTDYGKTFTSLVANLPTGPVNVLREDPVDHNILYVGTRIGAYVSINGGATWDVLGGNLPTVPVFDLQIHPRDGMIVVATYGRGLWVMDALKVRRHP